MVWHRNHMLNIWKFISIALVNLKSVRKKNKPICSIPSLLLCASMASINAMRDRVLHIYFANEFNDDTQYNRSKTVHFTFAPECKMAQTAKYCIARRLFRGLVKFIFCLRLYEAGQDVVVANSCRWSSKKC